MDGDLLNKIKFAMRIDGEDHDGEIKDMIVEAKKLIEEAGVSISKINDDDPLIRKACISYCKSNFGYDDKHDKFASIFKEMLIHLSLLSSYKGDENGG
ncbi:head-tail connector protein [Lysinibacillus fusiformis]|uniref:Uncharacterized phage protein (Possible DNA packaging) n=1 Tax=Lysinibacillus fusiformis TaxID=28031 RepID=A0A1H9HBQ2_9BACI|nr:head-tail connector protein [Lysinibacillus fusiformis]SCY30462.1 uncharacterized phage protein (possible DNA packaging) [Lysinibacillus fusiformis]SEN53230.1 uncharacterized phage protein (possible DNA packaging) [Lysinibacillus fusiformis]SEQ59770.1 uncharacterized phage protein (possible DNA packaging) [Lysinibacillus fusiformis]